MLGKLFGGAVALFIVVILLGSVFGKRTTEDRRADCSRHGETMAFIMSQEFVKRQLKSPSTAEFPRITANGVKSTWQGECNFQVIAFVDAQNSFGAVLRSRYIALLEYYPSSDEWRAKSVIIE